MLRQRFRLSLLAVAGLALLLASRPAAAQSVFDEGRGPMGVGRSYYESRGPGYSFYVPAANYADRYQFYPGYYTGYPIPSRFASSSGYYSTMSSGYSPIFLTSLNYPTVYGSYTLGPGGTFRNPAPVFMTRPDNLPSDYPVGAPYAPLARPLMDVPVVNRSALTTTRLERPAEPALIDVSLPADAVLTFQGVPMTKRGAVREFESPALVPGRTYTYDLHARWTDTDGHEVVRNRQLSVRAGDHLQIDLNQSPLPRPSVEEERPTLRTQPLPLQRDVRPPPKQ